MKHLIAVGDLHLNFWKAFSSGHGLQNSRFRRTLEELERSLAMARELNCVWVQVGDWVHTVGFTHNPILTSLIDLLNRYGDVEKYTVWGNHDARSSGGEIKLEETVVGVLAEAVENLTVLDRSSEYTRDDLKIYGCGYQPNPDSLFPPKPIGSSLYESPLYDVGLFHQTVEKSQLPSGLVMEDGLSREFLFNHFKLSIVGDIHEPQIFERGNRKILVPGSLEPHNFGDVSVRGYWYCTFMDDGEIKLTMIPSASPKFVTVSLPTEVVPDGNFYRVTTPCDPSTLPPGVIAVAPQPTTIAQRDIIKTGSGIQDILEAWINLTPLPRFDLVQVRQIGRELLGEQASTALKPIKLKKVWIDNFLCFEDVQLGVTEGITLVTGQSRDFTSNGAGKTSLFEAIFWCLFGKTTKDISTDQVILRGERNGGVLLEFDNGLSVMRTRERGASSKLEIHDRAMHWESTQKELQESLQKYLGLTPELYQALAYFSQSKLLLFSQATDSERKAMLADLCGLEIYQKASATARTTAQRLDQEIAKISQAIALNQDHLQQAEQNLSRLDMKVKAWDHSAEQQKASLQEKIIRLNSEIGVLELAHQEELEKLTAKRILALEEAERFRPQIEAKCRTDLTHRLELVIAERDKWWQGLDPLPDRSVLETRRTEILKELDEVINPVWTYIREQLGEKRYKLNTLSTLVESIENSPDKCSKCGQPIDRSQGLSQLAGLKEEWEVLEKEVKRLVKDEKEHADASIDATKKIRQIDGLLIQVKEREMRMDYFEKGIKTAEEQVESQLPSLVESELNLLRMQARNESDRLIQGSESKFYGESTQKKYELGILETAAKELQKNPYLEELTLTREELGRVLNKVTTARDEKTSKENEKEIYEYWTSGFSRSGIQSLLMDEIAVAFNQIRTLVFPTLTRGIYDVQFSTTSQTAAGESRERTEFVIRDHGAEIQYESLSGGQRRRIDLGVMLTLALAVARAHNVPGVLGILVLDEVFGFLDEDGVEALYETLEDVNKIVPSIYCVTHNPNLASLFKRTLNIIQNESGISRIADSQEARPTQRQETTLYREGVVV